MGFQAIVIQTSDDGIVVPAQASSGRTLISYENVGHESSHPFLVRLPEEVTLEQAMADLGPQAMEPPAWFFSGTFPGFVGETLPGQTSRAVVDLTAGIYLVLDDAPYPFEVVESSATPAATPAPDADGTVRLFEMGFELPESIQPGRRVLEVTNTGAVPHELLLVRSTVPLTAEQALALFMQEASEATPVGDEPLGADLTPVGGLGWLSPGMTAWSEVDFQPGTYIAVCFVFDPETGMPHAMQGMIDVFTVGETGTPVAATPVE